MTSHRSRFLLYSSVIGTSLLLWTTSSPLFSQRTPAASLVVGKVSLLAQPPNETRLHSRNIIRLTQANTITVTNNADSGAGSLRQVIASAQSGDTIRFDSSLANQTINVSNDPLNVDKDLTIDGADAPGLTLSGNNKTRVFFAANSDGSKGVNFTLRNITVANGFISTDMGAAIDLRNGGSLTLENDKFYNNVSPAGAVAARHTTTVAVTNSKFDSNDAAQYSKVEDGTPTGGAISVLDESKLTVKDCEFTNNKGTLGGAIGTVFTETIVDNSTFLNNSSKGFGGGLYVDGASRPTEARYLPAGVAPTKGPGRQVIVRNNSRFEGNHATGFGGGIAVWGYDHDYVTIENSTIINNEVTSDPKNGAKGGGLRLSGFINIKNTTITNNKSAQEGGGFWYDGGVSAQIEDSTFSGNRVGNTNIGKGGAIFSAQWASTTNIKNSTFTNNYSGSQGGGIYQDNVPAIVENSVFDHNIPDKIAAGSNAKQ